MACFNAGFEAAGSAVTVTLYFLCKWGVHPSFDPLERKWVYTMYHRAAAAGLVSSPTLVMPSFYIS
jgi:hypothetical protein